MNVDEVVQQFDGVKEVRPAHNARRTFMCKCPLHDDKHASLSISESANGRSILIHCFAGCETVNIIHHVGLKFSDLFNKDDENNESMKKSHREAEWIYRNSNIHVKIRKKDGSKTMPWYHIDDSSGKRVKGRNTSPPMLYDGGSFDTLKEKPEYDKTLWLVEGEKDVDSMICMGFCAASGEYGAGNTNGRWPNEYTSEIKSLCVNNVIIIKDNDDSGERYAEFVATELHAAQIPVRILDMHEIWKDVPYKGDISDYLMVQSADYIREQLCAMIEDLPELRWNSAGQIIKGDEEPTQISATDLAKLDVKPPRYIVDGMLSSGLAVFAAPPKFGKSWFVLDMCLSVASGEDFIGIQTKKCDVLYLALEDGLYRIRERMMTILDGKPVPKNCVFWTETSRLDAGLIDELQQYKNKVPDLGLIVVDTFAMIRGATKYGENAYQADYDVTSPLRKFAQKNNLCLLLVTHFRKMLDPSDVFNNISGSSGITGVVDTQLVFSRQQRSDKQTKLCVTGRDVGQICNIIEFDEDKCKWRNLGDSELVASQTILRKYSDNPVVQAIRAILKDNENGWSGKTSEFLALAEIKGYHINYSARKTGEILNRLTVQLRQFDGIVHARDSNGNAGGKHRFYYVSKMQEDSNDVSLP